MSRLPFTVPHCILEGAKHLFPTLDFSRIHFYIESKNRTHYTVGYLGRTEITFGKQLKFVSPCHIEYLKIICHELVHALQVQSLGQIIHRSASWTCSLLHGNASKADAAAGNCVEQEAYGYETLLAVLGEARPCTCINSGEGILKYLNNDSFTFKNESFKHVVEAHPELIQTSAGCTPWDCLGSGFLIKIVGTFLALVTLVISIGTSLAIGPVSYVTAVVGVVIGILAGISFGLVGAVAGAIVGGLIGVLLGVIVDWLVRLFGDDGGSLNLMFSNDHGQSWDHHASFDRTTEPISVAWGGLMKPNQLDEFGNTLIVPRLSVAWTGLDSHLNLLTLAQSQAMRIDFEESESCGPAVCSLGVRVHIAWQGTDNALNQIVTWNGQILANKVTLGGTESPADASPALCSTGSWVVLTYIGTDQEINLLSTQGYDYGNKLTLGDTASEDTTVAVTALDHDTVMIAWTGEDQYLNLMELQLGPNGNFTPGFKQTLNERSSDEAGPALASANAYLYLAWTGTDGQLNFMASENRGRTFFSHHVFEESREDCGPALTAHSDGTICIGWVGTDN